MTAEGFDQVMHLHVRAALFGIKYAVPAMKAVGVREISGFIAGDLTREKALAAAQQATRRYAKRQYTWLRHRLKSSKKLQKLAMEAQYSERILPEIFSFIRQFLLTTRK